MKLTKALKLKKQPAGELGHLFANSAIAANVAQYPRTFRLAELNILVALLKARRFQGSG